MKGFLRSKIVLTLWTMVLLVAAIAVPLASFISPSHAAGTSPPLGTAASFAVLGATTVTNTGPTIVTGDLGVSPGTACTGFVESPCTFGPGVVTGTIHVGADPVAVAAQSNAHTAYANAIAQTCDVNLTGQDLGGQTLTPAVYCFSSSAQLTGTLTLNCLGNPNAVFIFQIGSTLTTASGSNVVLLNCPDPRCDNNNIFWAVGSSATLGTGTAFIGNILAVTSITATMSASDNGSLYALGGAVTLDTNAISVCPMTPSPSPSSIPTFQLVLAPPGSVCFVPVQPSPHPRRRGRAITTTSTTFTTTSTTTSSQVSPAIGLPHLLIAPATVARSPAGCVVFVVLGTGFRPNTSVVISLHGASLTVQTDAFGTFNTVIQALVAGPVLSGTAMIMAVEPSPGAVAWAVLTVS